MVEDNKQAARVVFEIWSSGQLERLDAVVAPHVVHHDPYDLHAAEGLAGMKRIHSPGVSRHRAHRRGSNRRRRQGRNALARTDDAHRRARGADSERRGDHDHRGLSDDGRLN